MLSHSVSLPRFSGPWLPGTFGAPEAKACGASLAQDLRNASGMRMSSENEEHEPPRPVARACSSFSSESKERARRTRSVSGFVWHKNEERERRVSQEHESPDEETGCW